MLEILEEVKLHISLGFRETVTDPVLLFEIFVACFACSSVKDTVVVVTSVQINIVP